MEVGIEGVGGVVFDVSVCDGLEVGLEVCNMEGEVFLWHKHSHCKSDEQEHEHIIFNIKVGPCTEKGANTGDMIFGV
jgi:hypothetical protein